MWAESHNVVFGYVVSAILLGERCAQLRRLIPLVAYKANVKNTKKPRYIGGVHD